MWARHTEFNFSFSVYMGVCNSYTCLCMYIANPVCNTLCKSLTQRPHYGQISCLCPTQYWLPLFFVWPKQHVFPRTCSQEWLKVFCLGFLVWVGVFFPFSLAVEDISLIERTCQDSCPWGAGPPGAGGLSEAAHATHPAAILPTSGFSQPRRGGTPLPRYRWAA